MENWEKELEQLLDEYEKKHGTDEGMPWVDIGIYGTYRMLKAANGRRVIAVYDGTALVGIRFESDDGSSEVYNSPLK